MKKYLECKFHDGSQTNHRTVQGMKLAIKHGKYKLGVYKFLAPCGNIHSWEFIISIHVSHGRQKKKVRIGKGQFIDNIKAVFKGIN